MEEHLRELLPDAMQFFQKIHGLKREERERRTQSIPPEGAGETGSDAEGNPQRRPAQAPASTGAAAGGAFALARGRRSGKTCKITDEQRKQFMAVVQDMQKKIAPLIKEAQSGGDPRGNSAEGDEDPQGTRRQAGGPAHGCPEKAVEGNAGQAVGPGRVTRSPPGRARHWPRPASIRLARSFLTRWRNRCTVTNHDGKTAF